VSQEDYLKTFEEFLSEIDLQEYRNLRQIKTVEQDLPKAINPLYLIYKFYWDKKTLSIMTTFLKSIGKKT